MARRSGFHDIGSSRQAPSRGMDGWTFRICVAVVAGALIALGWTTWRDRISAVLPIPMGFGASNPVFTGPDGRIGRAAVAPILRNCIFQAMHIDPDNNVQPGVLYTTLKAGDVQAKVKALVGKADDRQLARLAEVWGTLATCIVTSNAILLCDSDNRAVAVDAVDTFLGKADRAIALLKRSTDDSEKTAAIVSSKVQVEAALRQHLRDGVLTAADFGFFPGAQISNLRSEVRPTRDACTPPRK